MAACELSSWGRHTDQGRANDNDAGQVWHTGTQKENRANRNTKSPENKA